MNEDLLRSCIDVTQILIRRPIIKFFWSNCAEVNSQSAPPLSFETICAKLQKNLYSSYSEWIDDVHRLFNFYINGQNQIYQCSAKQLKLEFDDLTSKFVSNVKIRLDKLKQIHKELSDLSAIYESEVGQISEELQPAAEIFTISSDSITDPIKVIKRNISLFKSPDMILRMAAILYKLQPETVIVNGEQIRFEFALMKPDTVNDLLRYTLSLVKAIASGKLDPYSYTGNSKTIDSYSASKQD
ncbi:hypothetical protein M9Y10_040782 [Tritrichomonas musculus]|uniref:Bromo domain-containing protein n=1 Tax=Tritrichomonas musculus TaxID=1915356 RepID=A0ABR2K3M0_9EUKA